MYISGHKSSRKMLPFPVSKSCRSRASKYKGVKLFMKAISIFVTGASFFISSLIHYISRMNSLSINKNHQQFYFWLR